ncbi:MAG: CoA transferase [Gammaproteobacteria bacterium]|nr:CoA transferase [Gammaproteobacteria bacterium]
MSGWFANTNQGKRGISVDLRTDGGKEILWRLLEDADVMIQGFRPGVISKYGFDYASVSARLPRIVYCSSTGFGESGPYVDQPVYDPVIQALSGWAGAQTVDGNPTLHKAMVSDKISASYNTMAILAALVQRGRTGEGCYLETSMLESNVAFNWPDIMMHCTLLEEDANHYPNTLDSYCLYECKDGWVAFAGGNDAQWKSFCEALDAPEHIEDPRFATTTSRGIHALEVFELTSELASRFTVSEFVGRLRAANTPVAPVYAPDEVKDDPQLQARNYVVKKTHPHVGRYLTTQPLSTIFGEQLDLLPAPMQGEHSREILSELGYSDEDIDGLQTSGVIRSAD